MSEKTITVDDIVVPEDMLNSYPIPLCVYDSREELRTTVLKYACLWLVENTPCPKDEAEAQCDFNSAWSNPTRKAQLGALTKVAMRRMFVKPELPLSIKNPINELVRLGVSPKNAQSIAQELYEAGKAAGK